MKTLTIKIPDAIYRVLARDSKDVSKTASEVLIRDVEKSMPFDVYKKKKFDEYQAREKKEGEEDIVDMEEVMSDK